MPTADGVQKRIEEIRVEAMYALRLIGWGDFPKEEVEEYDKDLEQLMEAQQKQAKSEAEMDDASDMDDTWVQNLTLSETS